MRITAVSPHLDDAALSASSALVGSRPVAAESSFRRRSIRASVAI
jgi:hypothetical protein